MAESNGNVSNKRTRTGYKFQASIVAVCDMKDEESDILKRHFGSLSSTRKFCTFHLVVLAYRTKT